VCEVPGNEVGKKRRKVFGKGEREWVGDIERKWNLGRRGVKFFPWFLKYCWVQRFV